MARAKKQVAVMAGAVVTEEKGVTLRTRSFLDQFPPVEGKQLEDELPVPQASVPGEVPAEEPPQEEPVEMTAQVAEAPVETPQKETAPVTADAPEKKQLDLSVILENSAEALGYSEEYIQQVYDSAVSAVEKLENKINRDREKLIEKRELVEELGRKFSFVTRTRDDLKGYVQGALPLKFDDSTADPPMEPEACAEIVETVPPAEEPQEPSLAAQELCEPEPELNIVTGVPDGEMSEDDFPF